MTTTYFLDDSIVKIENDAGVDTTILGLGTNNSSKCPPHPIHPDERHADDEDEDELPLDSTDNLIQQMQQPLQDCSSLNTDPLADPLEQDVPVKQQDNQEKMEDAGTGPVGKRKRGRPPRTALNDKVLIQHHLLTSEPQPALVPSEKGIGRVKFAALKKQFLLEMDSSIYSAVNECIGVLHRDPRTYHPFYLRVYKYITLGQHHGYVTKNERSVFNFWKRYDKYAVTQYESYLCNPEQFRFEGEPSSYLMYVQEQKVVLNGKHVSHQRNEAELKKKFSELEYIVFELKEIPDVNYKTDLKRRLDFFEKCKDITYPGDAIKMINLWSLLLKEDLVEVEKTKSKQGAMENEKPEIPAPVVVEGRRKSRKAKIEVRIDLESEEEKEFLSSESESDTELGSRKISQSKNGMVPTSTKTGDEGHPFPNDLPPDFHEKLKCVSTRKIRDRSKEKPRDDKTKDKKKRPVLTEEERRDRVQKQKFRRWERKIQEEQLSPEERERLKTERFLKRMAYLASVPKDVLTERQERLKEWFRKKYAAMPKKTIKERSRKQMERLRNLDPERKQRYVESQRRGLRKYQEKLRTQEPERFKAMLRRYMVKRYDSVRLSQREKVKNETDEEREKRLLRYRIAAAKRKTRKMMEEEGAWTEEQIEKRLEEVAEEERSRPKPKSTYKPRVMARKPHFRARTCVNGPPLPVWEPCEDDKNELEDQLRDNSTTEQVKSAPEHEDETGNQKIKRGPGRPRKQKSVTTQSKSEEPPAISLSHESKEIQVESVKQQETQEQMEHSATDPVRKRKKGRPPRSALPAASSEPIVEAYIKGEDKTENTYVVTVAESADFPQSQIILFQVYNPTSVKFSEPSSFLEADISSVNLFGEDEYGGDLQQPVILNSIPDPSNSVVWSESSIDDPTNINAPLMESCTNEVEQASTVDQNTNLQLMIEEPTNISNIEYQAAPPPPIPPNLNPSKSYVCDECGNAFTTKRGVQDHKYKQHNPVGSNLTCPECSIPCPGPSALWAHFSQYHGSSQLPSHLQPLPPSPNGKKCKIVRRPAGTVKNGLYPRGTDQPNVCPECDKSFHQKSTLLDHIRRVHQGKAYKCSECGSDLQSATKLWRHKKERHEIDTPAPPGTHVVICEYCSEMVIRGYSQHVRKKHPEHAHKFTFERVTDPKTKEIRVKCPQCPSLLNNELILIRHLQYKHAVGTGHPVSTHPCPECGKRFASKHKLARHFNQQHTFGDLERKLEAKKLIRITSTNKLSCSAVCLLCSASLPVRISIKAHFVSDHHEVLKDCELTSLPVFQCNLCEEKFPNEHQLTKHATKSHVDNIFRCQYCGDVKLSWKQLRAHESHHIRQKEEETDTCFVCKAEFKEDVKALREHISREHPEKCFRCESCSKMLYSKTAFSRHTRICFVRKDEEEELKNRDALKAKKRKPSPWLND